MLTFEPYDFAHSFNLLVQRTYSLRSNELAYSQRILTQNSVRRTKKVPWYYHGKGTMFFGAVDFTTLVMKYHGNITMVQHTMVYITIVQHTMVLHTMVQKCHGTKYHSKNAHCSIP